MMVNFGSWLCVRWVQHGPESETGFFQMLISVHANFGTLSKPQTVYYVHGPVS